ncbi:MAG: hypothetical protein HYV34_03570 [Candidatus Kerfeldbacteria bacterium]|nr:hypothetical protein [Candidatus Kerfeldbacteria bacterium]
MMREELVDELRRIFQEDFCVELSRDQTAAYADDYVTFFKTLLTIAYEERSKESELKEQVSSTTV